MYKRFENFCFPVLDQSNRNMTEEIFSILKNINGILWIQLCIGTQSYWALLQNMAIYDCSTVSCKKDKKFMQSYDIDYIPALRLSFLDLCILTIVYFSV